MWPLNGGSGLGKTSCALETGAPNRAYRTATSQPTSTDLPVSFMRRSPFKVYRNFELKEGLLSSLGMLLTRVNTCTSPQGVQHGSCARTQMIYRKINALAKRLGQKFLA